MVVSPDALRRCGPHRQVATLAGEALGTGWRVRFAAVPGADPGPLRAAIEARLQGIVDEMSQWQPISLLSRFNRGVAGSWWSLPPDFATVIAAALAMAERTGCAFDPTHGRAAALLGFGAKQPAGPPSPAELDAAHAAAGWRRLDFDPAARRLRQPGGLWLDLSGIAKGYAVDAVADLLDAAGHEDCLVEIGGELVGRGLKPDGQPWWVDLETPPGISVAPLRVALHDAAIATSGDYVRGTHTIDPRTGRPLPSLTASVSVVHSRTMLADAWATALTVLGPGDGMALAASEGLAVRMVEHGGREHLSPELASMIDA